MKKRFLRSMSTLFCLFFLLAGAWSAGSLHADAAVKCVWCNGKGEVRCTNCGGNMGYRCYVCHGYGYSTCKYCGGSGKLGADLSSSSSGSSSSSSSGSAKISISSKKLTLVAGRSSKLKVTGTKKKVTWSSSKKSVATVSKSGKVKAKKAGKATITAKVGNKKLKCNVTVKKKVYANGIKLSESSKSMLAGETATLTATVSPANITEKYTIAWSSSNNGVASVDQNGTVTANGPGTAVITAKVRGKTASCSINVTTGLERLQNLLATQGVQTEANTVSLTNRSSNGNTVTISFNSANRTYTVQYTEPEPVIVKLVCNESFTGNASVYYYWHGRFTDTELEGTTELTISSFSRQTKLSINYTKGRPNDTLVEASVRVALYSFQDYLQSTIGVSLRDIGFVSF